MARLGHKKSRNGCQRCKARHVKCDEARPCSNCVKHHLEKECSLVTGNPPVGLPVKRQPISRPPVERISIPEPLKTPPARTSSAPSLSIHYVLNPPPTAPPTSTGSNASSPQSQNDTYPFLTRFFHRTDSSQSAFTARDLELMHHWTISTSQTMSSREDVSTYWAVEGPKLAMPYPYLLQELLALSALHKANLEKDQRSTFYALGVYHQDLAIHEMRARLPTLNPDNAGAMFATGALLSMGVFASTGMSASHMERSLGKPRSSIDALLDIFSLLQGMYSILNQERPNVATGPFRILIEDTDEDWVDPKQTLFDDLENLLPSVQAFIEAQSLPWTTRSETVGALATLRTCLHDANRPRATTREIRFLFFWASRNTPTFFSMLRSKEPAALVVLAYYAVGFAIAEGRYWYMDGWGPRILGDIAEILGGQSVWRPVIQWPWEYVHRSAMKKDDGLPRPQQPHPFDLRKLRTA